MKNQDYSDLITYFLSKQPTDDNIGRYKKFYTNFLFNILDHEQILTQLYKLILRFKKSEPKSFLFTNKDLERLENTTGSFLKKFFHKDIYALFNRPIPTSQNKPQPQKKYDDPLTEVFAKIGQTLKGINDANKAELQYKTNFLVFLHNCLFYHGLHPDIFKRDPKIYKRYNFVLEHYYKSPNKKITEVKCLVKPELLKKEFLTPYEKQLPIKINGKLIPFESVYKVKITSSILLDDEIVLFAAKNDFKWSTNLNDQLKFANACTDETDDLLQNPFLANVTANIQEANLYFVHPIRIEELRKIQNKSYDTKKLIRLCEELNSAFHSNNLISASLLFRAIIDHVPPVFGCKNFTEVANNYSGGTSSFKKAMQKFDNVLRNIADNNIHSQIRQKEVLPTPIQINFTQELDLLLSEIIRIL